MTGHTDGWASNPPSKAEQLDGLEQAWREAQRVIYSDDYNDVAYWAAVERSKELQKQIDALTDDPKVQS